MQDGGRGLREGCVREVVGNMGRGPEGADPENTQMVFEIGREGGRDFETLDPAGVRLPQIGSVECIARGVGRVCGKAMGMP